MPASLYEQAGDALPLSQVVLLAALCAGLACMHRSMVVVDTAVYRHPGVWGFVWIFVIPCVLLPIVGFGEFFNAEHAFYIVKTYTLVLALGFALWYKLNHEKARPLVHRVAHWGLYLAVGVNVAEAVVWELAVLGQHWWNWVNAASGVLLMVCIVLSSLRWRVRAVHWPAAPGRAVEWAIYVPFTLLFALAYSVWNAAYVLAFVPEDVVLGIVAALALPLAMARLDPQESWIDARAHALLGSILLLVFPGVGLAEALKVHDADTEVAHGTLSVLGFVLSVLCTLEMLLTRPTPWNQYVE